jgi:pimeloyl-ACP methyl ester carboxylesterase
MTVRWALLLLLGGCAAAASQARLVDVGGYRIWTQLEGKGEPTVVFASGGSATSSAWANITPEVRRHGKVRTLVYDRAGTGKSEPRPGAYRVDDDATELVRALDACDVRGPIVLVTHAYGGFVVTLVAASDPRVAGAVLINANLANFFDAAETARIAARFAASFDALEKENPQLARVLIPVLRAYPESAARVREVTYPPSLPTIDILADRTWVNSSFEEMLAVRLAHRAFVEASPAREAVFAKGAGHNVMRDRPDVVIDAIVRMVKRVRGR